MNWEKKNQKEQSYVTLQDQVSQTANWMGTIFLAVVAGLFIFVSMIMLFVEGIRPLYLTYMMSALLIVFGIGLIVKYFVTEAYRSMHDYSFSGGALIVILGGCALARKDEVTAQIAAFIGLLVLAVAVVMLQQAMQLHIMQNRLWIMVLVISFITLISAIVLLFDLKVLTGRIDRLEYWILLIAGICTLGCMVISGIGVKLFERREEKEAKRMLEGCQQIESDKTQDHMTIEEEKQ